MLVNGINYFSGFCSFIPLLIGLFSLKKKSLVLNLLFLLSIIYATDEVLNFFSENIFGSKRIYGNVSTVIETIFILFFFNFFTNNNLFKKIIKASFILYIILSILEINNNWYTNYDPILFIVSSLFINITSAYLLIILSSDLIFDWKFSEFWIIISFLFYYSVSVTNFAFEKFLFLSHNGIVFSTIINSIANILLNLGLTKAFLCKQTIVK